MGTNILQQNARAFQKAIAEEDWGAALRLALVLEKALPDNAAIAYNKGLVLRRLGRSGDAARAFGQAHALEPGHVNALFEQASCALETGDADGAAEGFARYLRAVPGDVHAQLNLGNALVRLGRADEALGPLRIARERLASAEAIAALAIGLREAGDLEGCAAALADLGPGAENAALRLKIMTQGARGRLALRPAHPRVAR